MDGHVHIDAQEIGVVRCRNGWAMAKKLTIRAADTQRSGEVGTAGVNP